MDKLLSKSFAPLPKTKRGYGIHIDRHPEQQKCPLIVYCAGRTVVIINYKTQHAEYVTLNADANVARFSPSGYQLAIGDEDGQVHIVEYPKLNVKATYKIMSEIRDLDWDADSQRIVVVGNGGQTKAKVLIVDSGNSIGEISMHTQQILACTYRKHRPFRVVTASEDLSVNFYAGPPFSYKESFRGHSRYPNDVQYSPNGEFFITVGADGKIFVFNGTTSALVKEIASISDGHTGSIVAFDWSPDSKFILTASLDKTAKVWDIEHNVVVRTYLFGNSIDDQQVAALWLHDTLITVSLSGSINYLDLDNSDIRSVSHGHQTGIQAIALDSQRKQLFTSDINGFITRWNYETARGTWLKGSGHNGKLVSALAVSEGQLLSFGWDETLRFTPISSDTISADGIKLGGQPIAAAISQKNSGVAYAVLANQKAVVVRNQKVVHTASLTFSPQCIQLNSDETQLIIGSKERDAKLYVYDIEGDSLTLAAEKADHDKPITDVASSNQFIATVDAGKSIFIRDSTNLEVRNKSGWRFHEARINSAAFNSGLFRPLCLATGSLDTNIIVWTDFADFQPLRFKIERAHIAGVDIVRWWDDSTLISVGADRVVRVWSVSF